QQEWDWLLELFGLVNEDPENYKWSNHGADTVIETPAYQKNNWGFSSKIYYSSHANITNFIEVSDLMKEEKQDKIIFTKEEKEEFDGLKKKSISLYAMFININKTDFPKLYKRLFKNAPTRNNLFQLEFARAWANPDLIEVKEPRFAYELKPQFQDFFESSNEPFLGFDNP
ncbi:hypothetical protein, partial [Oenococcus oeni]